jgi:membrane-associated phospholipid phosphatase
MPPARARRAWLGLAWPSPAWPSPAWPSPAGTATAARSGAGAVARSVAGVGRPPAGDRPGLPSRAPGRWTVLAALVVGAWVTVDVLLDGPLRQLDHQVSRLVLATGVRDAEWPAPLFMLKLAVYATTKLGARNPMLLLTVPAVGLLAWRTRSWRPVLLLAVLLALLGSSVWLAKHAVGRGMPAVDGLHVPANRWAPAGRSFPSGHLPIAVTLWGLLSHLAADYRLDRRLVRALGVLRWLAPALTFVAMLLLDYHWLTDLVAGLALGVVLLRVGCEVDARALRNWSGARRRDVGGPPGWRPTVAGQQAAAAGPGGGPAGGRRAARRAGLDGHRAAGPG